VTPETATISQNRNVRVVVLSLHSRWYNW
jgi:hypothetical protein